MKIYKKIAQYTALTLLLVVLFLTLFAGNAFAYYNDQLWDSYEIPQTRQKERLVDNAGLLSSEEEAALLQRLNSLSATHNSNIAILTVNHHTGSIQDYADDYFDYNGFGADYDSSGILFMLSMGDREWAISTSGTAISAFTDYGQEQMMDKMLEDLSYGDYYDAFNIYCDSFDKYYEMYENGTPYDINNTHSDSDLVKALLICIVIGFILAAIPIFGMISSLHTVKMQSSAAGYQSHAGIHLDLHKDCFIRTATSRTPIPRNDDSRGGGGGGSSIHTSSSGGSHGGSHGHF